MQKKHRPANLVIPGNIVLIGFMGSGKSSVGRQLAKRLRFQFVDTDAMIVRESGSQISEIFAACGEEYFRELETKTIQSLRGKARLVVATGGGVVTRAQNIPLLRELGFVVWLTASEEAIFERVSRNKKRPLLQTENPRETIHALLAARRPFYQSASHLEIDTTRLPHEQIARKVIREARLFFADRKT